MVERRSPKPDVEGSSPSGRESYIYKVFKMNNTVNSIVTYFKGVKAEWSKINWPEKNQIIAETVFVIAIVTVFTISVYLIDLVFKGILSLIPMK